MLPTGANYSLAWNSARATSTNLFSNFDPLLNSNVAFNVTQPLLRNFKIDNIRQQLEISRKDARGRRRPAAVPRSSRRRAT